MLVELGRLAGDGRPLLIDVRLLMRSRLLLNASSGGGKSYALRRLAEQLWGKVPVILVDPEGEFASLREVAGYVLVGKGGEAPADPLLAARTMRRLLELRASAVCDLYELSEDARHAWVAAAATALVEAPKELWQLVVFMLDEAHLYAPERGVAESPARGPVTDLATRGRKRGQCLVAATQRLSALSKGVAGMLQNKLVGLTTAGVDQESAARELGVSRRGLPALAAMLRDMAPGHFAARGRAFVVGEELLRDQEVVVVGRALSSHPDPDSGLLTFAPPPLPEDVRRLLPQLADLGIAEEPGGKAGRVGRAGPAGPQGSGDAYHSRRFADLELQLGQVMASRDAVLDDCRRLLEGAELGLGKMSVELEALTSFIRATRRTSEAGEGSRADGVEALSSELLVKEPEVVRMGKVGRGAMQRAAKASPVDEASRGRKARRASNGEAGLGAAARALLGAMSEAPAPRASLMVWAGIRPGGHAARGFAELVRAGLAQVSAQGIALTPRGREVRGGFRVPSPTRVDALPAWEARLSTLEKKIWRLARERGDVTRAEISMLVGRRGGYLARAMSALVRGGLLVRVPGGRLATSPAWRALPEK